MFVNKITKIRLANPVGLCYNNGRRFGYASLNRKQVRFLREPVTVNAVVKITSSVCRTAASGNVIGKPRRHDGGVPHEPGYLPSIREKPRVPAFSALRMSSDYFIFVKEIMKP